ncbi:MAG: SUMF1/EgtB/PvdO family nonheme iron enzyme [Bacteroidales bacterium]|jgi:clan AA aspartic protease (TIGR02281 family)|nr:SUMF1/EgtB/PvdO family nonheme iron enzyme [Bacteroidales bacterium]
MRKIFIILMAVILLPGLVKAQMVIYADNQSKCFLVPCKVNGIDGFKFLYDSGASDVSISIAEAQVFVRTGRITEKDVKGSTYYQIANGEAQEGTKIIIRTLEIGDVKLTNVEASIIHNIDAPLLLGMSAISRLGKIEINGNKLTFYDVNKKKEEPFEMVFVKGGTFTMGCDTCGTDEFPAHKVMLSDFYIGKYEVTQAEWVSIMGDNPSDHKGDSLPVENVSWDDVQVFIKKLNAKTGKKYRLPTEAEWEYAAKGGNKSKSYIYSGSNDVDDVANTGRSTFPVGTKQANELGIYDMSGNVWEWVQDTYCNYPDSEKIYTNPCYTDCSRRVIRGGSWYYNASNYRVAYRSHVMPDYCYYNVGFRLACSSK